MKRLEGDLTLDTSVLVEYLAGSDLGRKVKDYFENLGPDEKAHCSIYTLSELFYIICRLRGEEFAQQKIDEMLSSNMISVHGSVELAIKTGKLKCERAISLADCSSIAVATLTRTRAVFIEEEELKEEMDRSPFEAEILFLDHIT